MGQLFRPSANTLARASIIGGLLFAIFAGGALYFMNMSAYSTRIDVPIEQEVPFSHKHHVDGLGIDCRFCHTSVEKSSFAGIPPTATCMKCHSILWNDSPMLEPVRESFQSGEPLQWNRVHDLPDHVYFDHSVHIAKGIGCATCHGQVDQMPLMRKANTLQMGWCLSCHKHPEVNVRPKGEVFNMSWEAPEGFKKIQKELAREYQVSSNIDCSVCHR